MTGVRVIAVGVVSRPLGGIVGGAAVGEPIGHDQIHRVVRIEPAARATVGPSLLQRVVDVGDGSFALCEVDRHNACVGVAVDL